MVIPESRDLFYSICNRVKGFEHAFQNVGQDKVMLNWNEKWKTSAPSWIKINEDGSLFEQS